MSPDYLRLKEAAAEYGMGAPTMSRLVRRLRIPFRPNPRDRRSKLVYRPDLEAALRTEHPPAKGSNQVRERALAALERARIWREELRRSGRTFLPVTEALTITRGEDQNDCLR